MRNIDRAVFGGAWALMLAGIATLLVLAVHPMGHPDRPCTFDGGGTIASGTTAAVSTGQTYFCSDGTLVRFYG
jgi:hypothetical protein